MYRDARRILGGRMMGDGKGKVHVRWWGRSASRLCNFSVVPVLETSETSENEQQQTIPAGN
jgi:hypothetical protein